MANGNGKWHPKMWHGVDLDGTLAVWLGFEGRLVIGPPIPNMLRRVRLWLKNEQEVRIVTARVDDCLQVVGANVDWDEKHKDNEVRDAIQDYTEKWTGQRLKVTNRKDKWMVNLWDDRARQVEMNTGKLVAVQVGIKAMSRLQVSPEDLEE